jgi:hypothetical protein
LLGGGFAVPSETAFKLLPLYLELCKCNKFPFVPLLVWSFNLHQKRNSVTASLYFAALLGWCAIDFLYRFAWWWFCSSKRNSFLNLCRLVCLLVWSFNLHQKRNSVTASLLFEGLPCLLCVCFVCAFASSK